MWLTVAVVTGVVLVATYLTWTAGRVDRLHARAAAAWAALDAQSVRRAAAVEAFSHRWAAQAGDADPEGPVRRLRDAARAVLAARSADRELAENDLTHQVRVAATRVTEADLAPVAETSRRLAMARQLHTDQVRDALAVRRHPVVRLFRFARNHGEPRFFDIDEPTL